MSDWDREQIIRRLRDHAERYGVSDLDVVSLKVRPMRGRGNALEQAYAHGPSDGFYDTERVSRTAQFVDHETGPEVLDITANTLALGTFFVAALRVFVRRIVEQQNVSPDYAPTHIRLESRKLTEDGQLKTKDIVTIEISGDLSGADIQNITKQFSKRF